MARRKPNEQGDEPVNPGEQQAAPAEGQAAGAGDAPDAAPARKSTWLARFPSWTDPESGVHLTEDRQNRRMTIKFDEKPSEEVRALMKGEQYGFRFDGEDEVLVQEDQPGEAAAVAPGSRGFGLPGGEPDPRGERPGAEEGLRAGHVKAGRRLSTFPSSQAAASMTALWDPDEKVGAMGGGGGRPAGQAWRENGSPRLPA